MPSSDVGTDLLDLILAHGHSSARNIAAEESTKTLTYEQLREEVLRAAGGLWQLGVRPGARVGILLPNSIDFIVSALATISIGAIYVPLVPDDPASRVRAIVAETDPTVIVLSRQSDDAVDDRDLASDHLVRSLAEIQSEMRDVAPRDTDPHRPVYCVFTSGTTGKPKGVVIRQDGLLAATRNSLTYYGLTHDARTVCFFPFHFDASYETIFTMLVAGGSLVIPARETVRIPRMYIETVVAEGVTHANISPSFLRLLLASPTVEDLAASKLTTLSLMGEACWAPDLLRLLSIHPNLRVFNRYGPTEATITVSTYEVDAAQLRGRSQVPIGRPDPGAVFVLVDESDAIIEAANTVGELYVGGVQLMAGYWQDTDGSSLRDDLVDGTRLYRTRDLVVREESGEYVYVDRNDNVVKRNGVRISLVEIAAALMEIDAVISAICVASPRVDNVVELAAFVTASAPTSDVELRRALRTRLPASMLPNVIRVVDEIPMTAAGKVDSAALRRTVWPEVSAPQAT